MGDASIDARDLLRRVHRGESPYDHADDGALQAYVDLVLGGCETPCAEDLPRIGATFWLCCCCDDTSEAPTWWLTDGDQPGTLRWWRQDILTRPRGLRARQAKKRDQEREAGWSRSASDCWGYHVHSADALRWLLGAIDSPDVARALDDVAVAEQSAVLRLQALVEAHLL